MKSTINGNLQKIPNCSITIPNAASILSQNPETGEFYYNPINGDAVIELNNLPDISDSKNAVYNGEPIIGRSSPLQTYSHSADRSINMQIHFFIVNPGDGLRNLQYLRAIQSAVYPRSGTSEYASEATPYRPPPICRIKCGKLLGDEELLVTLQSYSVKFPTEVAWDEETYCPYRFDVETSWTVVYTSIDLPFQDRIIKSGR